MTRFDGECVVETSTADLSLRTAGSTESCCYSLLAVLKLRDDETEKLFLLVFCHSRAGNVCPACWPSELFPDLSRLDDDAVCVSIFKCLGTRTAREKEVALFSCY